jgi:hypothetical protein
MNEETGSSRSVGGDPRRAKSGYRSCCGSHVARADGTDIARAVAAGERAFASWSLLTTGERAQILNHVADAATEAVPRLAELECLCNGRPIAEMRALPRDWLRQRRRGGQPEPNEQRQHPNTDADIALDARDTPVGLIGALVIDQVIVFRGLSIVAARWSMKARTACGRPRRVVKTR